MIKINNTEEITEQLAELMRQADKDMNRYQTDIYLYIGDDGNGSLEEFINVGGNSWLNDDHITVWSDKEHCEAIWDRLYDCIDDIAEAAGTTKSDIAKKIADDSNGIYEADEVADMDIMHYIDNHSDLAEKAKAFYDIMIDECDYYPAASAVLSYAIERENEKERW